MPARQDNRPAQQGDSKATTAPNPETDDFTRRRARLAQLLGRLLAHDWLRRHHQDQEPVGNMASEHSPPPQV